MVPRVAVPYFHQVRSCSHAFEFVVVIVMLICCTFTFRIAFSSAAVGKGHPGVVDSGFAAYIIYGLLLLICVMVPLTLRRVAQRWKRANADVSVDHVV